MSKSTQAVPVIALVGLALCSLSSSLAGPLTLLNLEDLISKSQLIVVGEVVSLRERGTTEMVMSSGKVSAWIMEGELDVRAVLKGSSNSQTISIHFLLPQLPTGIPGVGMHSCRTFFLKGAGNALEFTNPFYPSVISVPDTPISGADVITRVIDQVGAVLNSAKASPNQKLEAISVLRRTKNPAAHAALRRAIHEKDQSARLDAIAALLERNDISALSIAEAALMKAQQDVPEHILHNVRYAIGWGVTDEKAIPILARMIGASNAETRRAATLALWHTGSSAALKHLSVALDDSEFEVRYYAIVGLAEISGQRAWRPNMDEFKLDEKRYLKHWLEWRKTHSSSLSSSPLAFLSY